MVILVLKSWFYLIEYIWYRIKWITHDVDSGFDLIASCPCGERMELSRLNCCESSEMLGVWLAPNSDKTRQTSILKEAAIDWAGKVRVCNVFPKDA